MKPRVMRAKFKGGNSIHMRLYWYFKYCLDIKYKPLEGGEWNSVNMTPNITIRGITTKVTITDRFFDSYVVEMIGHEPECDWDMICTPEQVTITAYYRTHWAGDKPEPIVEFRIRQTINGKVVIGWNSNSKIPMDLMDTVSDIKDLLM